MAEVGRIAEYSWAYLRQGEKPDLSVPNVIRGVCPFVEGLVAVNASWDSGLLVLGEIECSRGWRIHSGHAVSPTIGQDLIEAWPYSGCGFDEWYFFRELPQNLPLKAFCNWNTSPANWEQIAGIPAGMNLGEQLPTLEPDLVVGENYGLFLIARDRMPVPRFLDMASGP